MKSATSGRSSDKGHFGLSEFDGADAHDAQGSLMLLFVTEAAAVECIANEHQTKPIKFGKPRALIIRIAQTALTRALFEPKATEPAPRAQNAPAGFY
jgi:hypothetical protein